MSGGGSLDWLESREREERREQIERERLDNALRHCQADNDGLTASTKVDCNTLGEGMDGKKVKNSRPLRVEKDSYTRPGAG